jgi:AcrR family transcriptional regulator
MHKTLDKRKRLATRRVVRTGRPPREFAGEVEARILDAARQVFLERGLAGASVDEIAARARAGKPTIYARFPGKEALFTAVVMRNVAQVTDSQPHPPVGANIEERLASVGLAVLQQALTSDTIGLMRLGIAESPRFPDLGNSVHRQARERGVEAVGRLLGEVAHSNELDRLPAFAPERLALTTRFFLDLVLLPMMMRALFGEKLKTLHAEIEPHVARSVAFFFAACRSGGIT